MEHNGNIRRRKKQRTKKVVETIMTENFSKLDTTDSEKLKNP